MSDLHKDMMAEARDLLGSGFTKDYYDSSASGFTGIAEHYSEQLRTQIKELESKLSLVLEACEIALPSWHEDDDGSQHDGHVAGEISWGDVRRIKKAIAKAKGASL